MPQQNQEIKIEVEDVVIKANSRPQLQFLEEAPKNDETLYGGAAGPGKTWAGIVLPLYHGFHDVSGFRGQIFRETSVQLEEEIVPTCSKYYSAAGGLYNIQKRLWKFPSGAQMRLCYMQDSEDWKRWAGGNNAYQMFDEACQIRPENYAVTTWNRSDCGIPTFRVYLTNPGGPSHKKFKSEFVDPSPAINEGPMRYSELAKMWWQPKLSQGAFYLDVLSEGVKKQIRRQFIPGRVFDNEDLLKNNPNYVTTLLLLPEEKRKMLLEGSWDYIAGMFFEKLSRDIHWVKPFEIPGDWPVSAGMDYGNVTVAEVIAMNPTNRWLYVIYEWLALNKRQSEKASSYAKFLHYIGYDNITTWADTNMFATTPDIDEKNMPADAFKKLEIDLKPVTKRRDPDTHKRFRLWCNDKVKDLIEWEKDKNGMFTRKPKLYIFNGRAPYLTETIMQLIRGKTDPEDLEDAQDDHGYDALKYDIIHNKWLPSTKEAKEMFTRYLKKTFV